MPDTLTIDLGFMGATQAIAAFAVPTGDGGCALIETGPASCADTLTRGLEAAGHSVEGLRGIFVTHIHLDHSGGAGVLARKAGCPVWVHPEGAVHLIDPSRLLASAERLYGDRMEALWGRIEPVGELQVRTVDNGERVTLGSTQLRGWHTPGHAMHHVAWQIGDAIATGDVGGVRFPDALHVVPPTPPPDIDIESWRGSLELLRRLAPSRLLLTHFGAFDDVKRHLDELEDRLARWTAAAERVTAEKGTGAGPVLATELESLEEAEMHASGVSAENRERYGQLCPMDGNVAGLIRYWAKRREAELS